MKENNIPDWVAFAAITIVGVSTYLFGCITGEDFGVKSMQQEAIKRGYARRIVNQETAEVSFVWKEEK